MKQPPRFQLCAAWLLALHMLISGCQVAHSTMTPTHTVAWSETAAGRHAVTEHYEIFSTLTDVEFERQLPRVMEAGYVKFAALISPDANAAGRYPDSCLSTSASMPPCRRMPVYIFGTRAEWQGYTRLHFPARSATYARIHAGGYTEGDTAVIFCTGRSETLATLLHEGWHQYGASNIRESVPAWLNEGLACHFESAELRGDELVVRAKANMFRLNSLRRALQEHRLLSLRELLSTDAGEALAQGNSQLTQIYYAQVWGLVECLMGGTEGRFAKGFDSLLSDVQSGQYRVRLSAARLGTENSSDGDAAAAMFRDYFGATPDEMQLRYERFLNQLAGF